MVRLLLYIVIHGAVAQASCDFATDDWYHENKLSAEQVDCLLADLETLPRREDVSALDAALYRLMQNFNLDRRDSLFALQASKAIDSVLDYYSIDDLYRRTSVPHFLAFLSLFSRDRLVRETITIKQVKRMLALVDDDLDVEIRVQRAASATELALIIRRVAFRNFARDSKLSLDIDESDQLNFYVLDHLFRMYNPLQIYALVQLLPLRIIESYLRFGPNSLSRVKREYRDHFVAFLQSALDKAKLSLALENQDFGATAQIRYRRTTRLLSIATVVGSTLGVFATAYDFPLPLTMALTALSFSDLFKRHRQAQKKARDLRDLGHLIMKHARTFEFDIEFNCENQFILETSKVVIPTHQAEMDRTSGKQK